MMSENVMIPPLFHQRSHSMPVGHAFINNNNHNNEAENNRTFDFKRSSPLKNDSTTCEMFPLPIPKSIASQLNNSSTTLIETDDEPNFFCKPKTLLNLFDYSDHNNNRKITSCPIVFNCKMDRGFFTSQSHWTCYRRNYFQVTASFIIPGHSEGTCYALQLNDKPVMQPIQQFFLRLKASTSSNEENHTMIRPVALTQMTPKRDKGPQREPPIISIIPSDTVYGCEQVCVTFERLQFRVATANNGKRRASQQYFRLIFDLIAQIEDGTQHTISECYSSPLVVRGRSPGHYSLDPQQRMANTKKRKSASPSPNASHDKQENNPQDTSDQRSHSDESSTQDRVKKEIALEDKVTLPPPQYVYSSPPMVIEQQQSSPAPFNNIMTNTSFNNTTSSAFSNFHNRSQSANDSQFFARHRQGLKYQPLVDPQQNNEIFDPYDVGMARALRNWQQQVSHQRNDAFESYDNSSRATTRPGTPVPYTNNYGQQPWTNSTHFIDQQQESNNKMSHHDSKLYNNNNN